jgi:hypothetical protein
LLRQVSTTHGLQPMLFQLSILRNFQALLSDRQVYKEPALKPVLKFASKVVRGFFKALVPSEEDLVDAHLDEGSKDAEVSQPTHSLDPL